MFKHFQDDETYNNTSRGMSGCIQIKTKKYQTRKGPPYHAKDCKGKTKKGNDKKSYVSASDSKGVYQWIPKSKETARLTKKKKGMKTYHILDNGSNTFSVDVSPSHIQVYRLKVTDNGNIRDKKIVDTSYIKVFIGDNNLKIGDGVAPKGKYPGNSIFIQIKPGKYIYVGSEIYSFSTWKGENINEYYSLVGNSGVPYPYAVGEHYTYFMLDKCTLPNELLDLKKDAYGQYYGFTVKDDDRKKKIESSKKKFITKLIHKRNIY